MSSIKWQSGRGGAANLEGLVAWEVVAREACPKNKAYRGSDCLGGLKDNVAGNTNHADQDVRPVVILVVR